MAHNPTFNSLVSQLRLTPAETPPPELADQIEITLRWFERVVANLAAGTETARTVSAGYLADREFNAFAGTVDGRDVVAVNLGILIRSQNLCSMALASNVDVPWLHPDRSRRSVGLPAIRSGAVRYVFLHELGHIWKGHTLLIAQQYGRNSIDEMNMASSSRVSKLDAQTMEMDADVFAISGIVLQQLHRAKADSWINPEFEEINGNGAAAVASSLFAIYLVWRMFEEACDLKGVRISSHPPAPMRQNMIFAHALSELTGRHGFEFSKASAIIEAVFKSAELCYAAARGHPVDVAGFAQTISPEGHKYVGSLISNLEVLRPRLQLLLRNRKPEELAE
ncbi:MULTISPECIES: hypothetical protein [Bradyrhizobium]